MKLDDTYAKSCVQSSLQEKILETICNTPVYRKGKDKRSDLFSSSSPFKLPKIIKNKERKMLMNLSFIF